jgi:hypothetical protein
MANEPTIVCPNCRADIKLTDSLAAPLIEATKAEYERRLAEQRNAVADREADLPAELRFRHRRRAGALRARPRRRRPCHPDENDRILLT